MIYYAMGVVAVVFFVILRKKISEGGAVPLSDSEWDARGVDGLSRALRDRFARF